MVIDSFDRAIAGESLTKDLSDQPFSKPPTITGSHNAFVHMTSNIEEDEDLYSDIIGMMEAGVELESIANIMTFGAFKEGIITPDVAMSVNPMLIIWLVHHAMKNDIDVFEITNYRSSQDAGNLSPNQIFDLMEFKNPKRHREIKRNNAKNQLEDLMGAIEQVQQEDMETMQPSEPKLETEGFMAMQPETSVQENV